MYFRHLRVSVNKKTMLAAKRSSAVECGITMRHRARRCKATSTEVVSFDTFSDVGQSLLSIIVTDKLCMPIHSFIHGQVFLSVIASQQCIVYIYG